MADELETAQASLTAAQSARDDLTADVADDVQKAAVQAVTDAQAALDKTKADADKTAPRFSQADLDRVAAKTRDEERAKLKKDTEAEKRKQDEAKQREQGEWKSLVETRDAELADLAPRLEKAESLAAALAVMVNESIDAETRDWHKDAKALDPGADDVQARLEYVQKCRPLAKTLSQLRPADTGLGARGGNGAAAGNRYDQIRQEKEAQQQAAGASKTFQERMGLTPNPN